MAIQLPNNKISRTLPEQVGFNSEKIAQIIKWINDSDFIDKVIDLSDPSGVLTNEQYSIAELNPSYIIYGGKVFIKSLEDTDNIDFIKAGTDMSGSTSIVASIERVRVVKATKSYTYAVVQLFESYNKTQLDSLLAAKADLSGATFTGDVVAKTLKQIDPNYELEFTFESGVSGVPTGITITNIFSKCIQYGNILYVIGNFLLENITESSISITSLYKSITLPSTIADKIFDYGGKKVSEAQPDNTKMDITTDVGFTGISNIVSSQVRNVYLRHPAINQIQFEIGYGTSIAAGSKNAFTFRTFLILA